MKQAIRKLVLGLMLVLFMSSCYWNDEVATNQVGVQLDANRIINIVEPGVYTDMGFYADLKTMDIDTLTFSVEDPEVLTSDNQAVGVKITIQARRKNDDDSVKNLLTKWSTLVDNQILIDTISATAREGMKNGTRGFTLTSLLDDRNDLSDAIELALKDDVDKYSVEIVNVTVENIAPSVSYMGILGETANIKAQTDQEIRRQDLINQRAKNAVLEQEQRVKVAQSQVLAEQAETNVQVEIAQREGEVTAASNQVYTDNPQAFELERLRLLKDVLGDKVIFLPSDAILTLLQGAGGVLPLPTVPVAPAGQ